MTRNDRPCMSFTARSWFPSPTSQWSQLPVHPGAYWRSGKYPAPVSAFIRCFSAMTTVLLFLFLIMLVLCDYSVLLSTTYYCYYYCSNSSSSQTWIQDFLIQDQDEDSAVSRPRLWCPRPRPRLKTYKTNTGSP